MASHCGTTLSVLVPPWLGSVVCVRGFRSPASVELDVSVGLWLQWEWTGTITVITRHVKLQCCAGLHALYLQLETQGQRLLTFHFPVGHTHQGLYSKGLYVPKQACLLRLYFHSKGTDCACRGRSVFLGEVSVLRLWDPAVLEFSGLLIGLKDVIVEVHREPFMRTGR